LTYTGYLTYNILASIKQYIKFLHSLNDIKILLLTLQHMRSSKVHHCMMNLPSTFISSSRSVLIYSLFHLSFTTRTILLLIKLVHSGIYWTESLKISPPTYSVHNFLGMACFQIWSHTNSSSKDVIKTSTEQTVFNLIAFSSWNLQTPISLNT